MTWREGTISQRLPSWRDCDRYRVATSSGTVTALAYRHLVGKLTSGTRVWLNTAALDRDLGTGGVAFIIAPQSIPPDVTPRGHIVKARYTPQQVMVATAEDEESPYHELFINPPPLTDLAVVVADLHSTLPAVVAGIRHANPEATIAYIMTDGAALPAAFSHTVSQLRERELLAATITCGQAFGGDYECTSVVNALICARRIVGADIAVVGQGPGNVGTGTTFGFSGLDCIWHMQQAAMIGAQVTFVVRASSADRRARHRGLSHHTMRVLEHLPLSIPIALATDAVTSASSVARQLDETEGRHRVVSLPVDFAPVLERFPITLKTMGRSYHDDPLGFHIAAAAGYFAAG
ncbi:MAG: DUF3866 family protein [Bowdeniella nasicola]|nr:DUF3866 family protein [Bowdeniella nasicola]